MPPPFMRFRAREDGGPSWWVAVGIAFVSLAFLVAPVDRDLVSQLEGMVLARNGTPVERRGRKVTGLLPLSAEMAAELPKAERRRLHVMGLPVVAMAGETRSGALREVLGRSRERPGAGVRIAGGNLGRTRRRYENDCSCERPS